MDEKIDISIQRGRTWASFDLYLFPILDLHFYAGGGSGSNENKIELIPEAQVSCLGRLLIARLSNPVYEMKNGIHPKCWEK